MTFRDWLGRLFASPEVPEAVDRPTSIVRDLFNGHRTPVTVRGSVIYPDAGGPPLRVLFGVEGARRLDVLVDLPDGRTIIECMAGFGNDDDEVLRQAITTFTLGVFHVLLKAFYEPDDPHMGIESWTVAGQRRRVVVGDIVGRASGGVTNDDANRLVSGFLHDLQGAALPGGTHWVRLYAAQMKGNLVGIEVLLNNDTWDEMQAKFTALPWPKTEGFYSVRLFIVIQDEPTG